jgi:flagellar biosynthesis protein
MREGLFNKSEYSRPSEGVLLSINEEVNMVKKQKTASALAYSREDAAPRLLASGRGREAERIITLAQEAGIAIVEDSALAALLNTEAKIGDIIPVWCWEAAAKILAFVSEKDKK